MSLTPNRAQSSILIGKVDFPLFMYSLVKNLPSWGGGFPWGLPCRVSGMDGSPALERWLLSQGVAKKS